MSALFALLFTALVTFELFVPALAPVYGSQSPLVMRVPYGARLVREGDKQLIGVSFEHQRIVVPRGTLLDPRLETHRAAVAWDASRRPPTPARLGGIYVLYLFGCMVVTHYQRRYGHPRLKLLRTQLGVFSLMAVGIALAKAFLILTPLPAFWLPVAVVGFWCAVSFDRRTALLLDLALSFMVAALLRFDLLLLSVFVIRGIVATLLFINRKQPRHMLIAGLVSGIAAAFTYVALIVGVEGGHNLLSDARDGLGSELLACVGGGVLSGLVANMLREPAVRVLGHVSRSRLLDLTDIETPLLRKLATDAPGSWEHSRAMANLAEAAAASIGADPLLTRVGAYYHDLGKTVQHKYFIENLMPGEASPHDELEPEVSADAIMAHVVLGAKMLREGGVPEPVVEFAYTHHGTQVVEYFWNKYREKVAAMGDEAPSEDERLTEDHFRYPGMKPMTKETAILMVVDSVEAASRTVEPPSHAKFEEMIRRVLFHKLKAGQLDDSGLTITDLRIITDRMTSTLVNMFHGRIKYPWQIEREKEEAAKRRAAAAAKDAAVAKEVDAVLQEPNDAQAGSARETDAGETDAAETDVSPTADLGARPSERGSDQRTLESKQG